MAPTSIDLFRTRQPIPSAAARRCARTCATFEDTSITQLPCEIWPLPRLDRTTKTGRNGRLVRMHEASKTKIASLVVLHSSANAALAERRCATSGSPMKATAAPWRSRGVTRPRSCKKPPTRIGHFFNIRSSTTGRGSLTCRKALLSANQGYSERTSQPTVGWKRMSA